MKTSKIPKKFEYRASLASNSGLSRRDWFKGVVSASAVAALSGPAQVTNPSGATPKISTEPHIPEGQSRTTDAQSKFLAERAVDYLQQVLEVARGPGGLIISWTSFDTRRPVQECSGLGNAGWGKDSPAPTVAEAWYGENTLWATGWLLWSQMLRYQVTGEAEALAIARKCFQDLNHVFDLSRTIEPGLLGKPHGGRAGETTSFDQSAMPVLLYVQFAREYGTPAERDVARQNMHDHGDYYLRRNWLMNHHGRLVRIVPAAHPSAMKYFACIYAAYVMTGQERFRDAAVKHVGELITKGLVIWPSVQYEMNHSPWYYSWLDEYWSQTSLADAFDWIGNIGIYWDAAQRGLNHEGLMLNGAYNTKTKQFTPAHERPAPAALSLMIAVLGLMARKHGFDDRAHEISRKILLRINRDCLRQCWDDGQLPPDLRFDANLFPAECPAEWLTAYWMGRQQKVW